MGYKLAGGGPVRLQIQTPTLDEALCPEAERGSTVTLFFLVSVPGNSVSEGS